MRFEDELPFEEPAERIERIASAHHSKRVRVPDSYFTRSAPKSGNCVMCISGATAKGVIENLVKMLREKLGDPNGHPTRH